MPAAAPPPSTTIAPDRPGADLRRQWRTLGRAMLVVALLTSPGVFVYFAVARDLHPVRALLYTVLAVAAVRGVMEVVARRFLPTPILFDDDSDRARRKDATDRRRWWTWRWWVRLVWRALILITIVWLLRTVLLGAESWLDSATWLKDTLTGFWDNPQNRQYLFVLPMLFLVNFLILFGPLAAMGIAQIKSFEPGDANWGVKLDDVRGQKEAKEEIRRIVALWQSGERFEKAGGKRERGILFMGRPGTGKTMLAKAIATSFNCPFVSIPGSGFAQTFIGMDAVIVRFLAFRARKLARKWGGQCIVFIDEIDAVGMRRSSLGTGAQVEGVRQPHLHGPDGTLVPGGDMVIENAEWRDWIFDRRAPERRGPSRAVQAFNGTLGFVVPGGMGGGMGGGLALNQLLVVMDGMGEPPYFRKLVVGRVNTLLDALWIVPQRIGGVSLRLPPARPRTEQIYFIGACNVPLEALDPALVRPGRLGRHVLFRTPTKEDRRDIFDLYITKVAHEPDLDTPKRRDEIARVTSGYSPAMIEQVCSMALTVAHHDGRKRFGWGDLLDAMGTVEAGQAIDLEKMPDEERAVAIHEAGHAIASHLFVENSEASRLSIRPRTSGSHGLSVTVEKAERFIEFRDECYSSIIATIAAMAAEYVFYGQNTQGVGGDLWSVTYRAEQMVGQWGMTPPTVLLVDGPGRLRTLDGERERREAVEKRFEALGRSILGRGAGEQMLGGGLRDPIKLANAGRIVGMAFCAAYHVMRVNREAVDRIADVLVERREIYGDELIELLDEQGLVIPAIDYELEASWPTL